MPDRDQTSLNPPRRRRKMLLIFILLIAVLGGGYYFYKSGDVSKAISGGATAPADVVTIARGDIEETVTAQGKLEPKDYVDVGAQVSGQLIMAADIGALVKKNQLIGQIDPQIYQSKVDSDQAHIQTIQAQLNQQIAQSVLAKQQADRNRTLIAQDAISKDAYDTTEANYKVALAEVDSLKAQLKEEQFTLAGDQANLGYTKIYSPMDGTVVSQTTKQGQTINSNQQAPTIVEIANLDIMTVRAQVAEADVMNLKEGMDVYFTTLGNQTRKWQGKVRQIQPTPETVNDVVLYDVLVDVDNKDRQLMTGMSTQMFFVQGSVKNAVVIPVSALGRHVEKKDSDAGTAYMVHVLKDGATEQRLIHVGLMSRTVAEVRDGLAEGEQVVPAVPKAAGDGAAKAGNKTGGMRGMGGGPRL